MAVGGGFRARAGTLTLICVVSDAERDVLRTLLAEAATGIQAQELEPPPGRDDKYRLDIFNDSYLLEPADPDLPPGTPVGPDTKVQPTPAGREFFAVAQILERWLRARPAGPLKVDEECGEAVVALLVGWSANVTHVLAAQPLTIAETCEALPTLHDEVVDDYMTEMERVGLLETVDCEDGETRYEPTEWLRLSVAPLAAAARQELRFPPGGTAPIAVADVAAAFGLALPLLRLPGKVSGSCSLVVELDEEVDGPAAITVRVEDGRIAAIEAGRRDDVDACATAPASEWLDAVIDDARVIEMSGDLRLARYLVNGLHEALFGKRRRARR